ncbi:MAG TPA: DUF475 domain-containing protein [Candidatus Saccharimonadales bacterium]|nr:DUF475 domain-containing protein [Candidatus Saccharimonadales bacterium]
MLRYFGFSIFITIAAIVIAGWELGLAAALTTVILIAIEVAFSFDNAVINAKVLTRLSRFWQQLFLTVGILIAVIGMRFVFPILIVMITAGLPWNEVIDQALNHPDSYAKHLEEAHAAISAFGGAFLLTLTFYFFFDDLRKELWIRRIERPLQKIGGSVWLPPLLTAIIVIVSSFFLHHDRGTVLQAGLLGAGLYAALKIAIDAMERLAPTANKAGKAVIYTGWPALFALLYLEVLDASFSFDGVLGAFAITDMVLIIALGLGVGAIWVRSLTVYMVRKGTLQAYKYLEHGAHYAILFLAAALFSGLFIKIPEAIIGIVGLGIILASYQASREAKHAQERGEDLSKPLK